MAERTREYIVERILNRLNHEVVTHGRAYVASDSATTGVPVLDVFKDLVDNVLPTNDTLEAIDKVTIPAAFEIAVDHQIRLATKDINDALLHLYI